MANQEKNCYLGINGKKYGPVSEADIHKLYDAKKITGDTKFARVGAKEWIPLSQSGIVKSTNPIDDLPPLPQESKAALPSQENKNPKPFTFKKNFAIAASVTVGSIIGIVLVVGIVIAILDGANSGSSTASNNDVVAAGQENTYTHSPPPLAPTSPSQNTQERTATEPAQLPNIWSLRNTTDAFGDETGQLFLVGEVFSGTFGNRDESSRDNLEVALLINEPDEDVRSVFPKGLIEIRLVYPPRSGFRFGRLRVNQTLQIRTDAGDSQFQVQLVETDGERIIDRGFLQLLLVPDPDNLPDIRFWNYLYEGKEISAVFDLGDVRHNFTIDGTGFSEVFDEFQQHWQNGILPNAEANIVEAPQAQTSNEAIATATEIAALRSEIIGEWDISNFIQADSFAGGLSDGFSIDFSADGTGSTFVWDYTHEPPRGRNTVFFTWELEILEHDTDGQYGIFQALTLRLNMDYGSILDYFPEMDGQTLYLHHNGGPTILTRGVPGQPSASTPANNMTPITPTAPSQEQSTHNIVGTWELFIRGVGRSPDNRMILEFRADGTVAYTFSNIVTATGVATYEIVGGVVTITYGNGDIETGIISGDELLMDGFRTPYRRVVN